ncbi:hypothetical protein B0H17DRAFT_1224618 [Mycena rosella]|uniref:DUF6534 domain-containing protein n=1 Tax=Mycena rosella TaxID=1033263 RepID=A0AAD7M7I5_MYCRO|nr:hypothetical protein B0H17DRAFT_1224618 [Mycena rosella]
MSSSDPSSPSPSTITAAVGPLILGFAFQQLLLGMIFAQARLYYVGCAARDGKLYSFLVGMMVVLNVLEGVMDIHVLYRTIVTHYGDFQYFDMQTWTMWAEPGITALIGFLAQIFFIERCVRVTNYSPYVIAGLSLLRDADVSTVALLSLGSGVAVSISFSKVKLFSLLAKIPIPIAFWLISTAVTDFTITAILCVALWRSRRNTSYTRTETVISKLIRLSIETSLVTAVVALANLGLYFGMITTAYHLLPQLSICRVYTITVLVTLMTRDALRRELDGESYHCRCNRGALGFRRPRVREHAVSKLEVKMTTIIERDHPEGSIGESEPKPKQSLAMAPADTKLIWSSPV